MQGEHSVILSTFNKLQFVIKIFVLSIFEWPFYSGLLFYCLLLSNHVCVVMGLCLALCYDALYSFAIILPRERGAICFILSVFLLSCVGLCSISLPHGAVWLICGIRLWDFLSILV